MSQKNELDLAVFWVLRVPDDHVVKDSICTQSQPKAIVCMLLDKRKHFIDDVETLYYYFAPIVACAFLEEGPRGFTDMRPWTKPSDAYFVPLNFTHDTSDEWKMLFGAVRPLDVSPPVIISLTSKSSSKQQEMEFGIAMHEMFCMSKDMLAAAVTRRNKVLAEEKAAIVSPVVDNKTNESKSSSSSSSSQTTRISTSSEVTKNINFTASVMANWTLRDNPHHVVIQLHNIMNHMIMNRYIGRSYRQKSSADATLCSTTPPCTTPPISQLQSRRPRLCTDVDDEVKDDGKKVDAVNEDDEFTQLRQKLEKMMIPTKPCPIDIRIKKQRHRLLTRMWSSTAVPFISVYHLSDDKQYKLELIILTE